MVYTITQSKHVSQNKVMVMMRTKPIGGSAGVFADVGIGLFFWQRHLLGKEEKLFSRDFRFTKSQFGGRNFIHLKITTYILQIHLELAQHTKYLAVFQFKSPTALTIFYGL